MSTICYGKSKWDRIWLTLKEGVPEPEVGTFAPERVQANRRLLYQVVTAITPIDRTREAGLEEWIKALEADNAKAFIVRYAHLPTDEFFEVQEKPLFNPKTAEGAPYTLVELFKALQGISYNLDDVAQDGGDRIEEVLGLLACRIVQGLPEYNEASTW